MRGVGVPGGPKGGTRSSGNKAKQAIYRQSEAGRLARKIRSEQPEHRAIAKAHRDAKRHLLGK